MIKSSFRVNFPFASIRYLEVLAIQDHFTFLFFSPSNCDFFFSSHSDDLKLSCGLCNDWHTSSLPSHLVQPFKISTKNMGVLLQSLPLIVLDYIFNPPVLQQCQKCYSASHLLLDHQLYPATNAVFPDLSPVILH